MVFLYYLAGKQAANQKLVKEIGLGEIFLKDTPWGYNGTQGGPDGGTGVVIALDVKDGPQGIYDPDNQTWQNTGDGIWVGMQKDNPPKPDLLEKDEFLSGHKVKLLNGSEWVVPVARHFYPAWGSPIPKVYSFDKKGKPAMLPDERYIDFCIGADDRWYWFCRETADKLRGDTDPKISATADMYDVMVEGIEAPPRPTNQERFDFAAKAIAINYKLSGRELRALRLIGENELKLIEEAIFDVPTMQALGAAAVKKKQPSTPPGSGSKDMNAENSQATPQPMGN